ncbi:MAG: L-histidine N(alpha)-methyltransferase [Halobacteriovoraceae bacterium]|nr:L-histidine N(alpha)-methyltransferase [Halobacteriovoraceae bacterium]
MSSTTKIDVLSHDVKDHGSHELALSVLEGLSANPKELPSRFFYDDKGSDLFKQIMALPEYYPTDCEAEIIEKQGKKMASFLGQGKYNIVELGCGDGAKTIKLFQNFMEEKKEFNFVPLDISQAAVEFLIENLKKEYGEIPFNVQGLVAEYFQGLSWLSENASEKNMVLFLGSNIGNFNKPTSMRFLRSLWYSLNNDDLVLIGFDLKKDLDILYDAYNDSKGVTKEFNFNVLDRINQTLGGNFKRENFQHQGLYNIQTGAMESYLIAQKEHKVEIKDLGKSFNFKPWEPIHMEYSYKYLPQDIEYLAQNTGFEIVENFKDSRGYFVDSLWRVKK